jgi:hypothetical protein
MFMNVYCVILCRLTLMHAAGPRIKSFYLSADSAERAMLTAAGENPQWRAIGIEPRGFFFSPPQADHADQIDPHPDNVHAA